MPTHIDNSQQSQSSGKHGKPYCAPGYAAVKGPDGDCLCKFPQYSVAIPCGDRPPSCTPVDSLDYPTDYSKSRAARRR